MVFWTGEKEQPFIDNFQTLIGPCLKEESVQCCRRRCSNISGSRFPRTKIDDLMLCRDVMRKHLQPLIGWYRVGKEKDAMLHSILCLAAILWLDEAERSDSDALGFSLLHNYRLLCESLQSGSNEWSLCSLSLIITFMAMQKNSCCVLQQSLLHNKSITIKQVWFWSKVYAASLYQGSVVSNVFLGNMVD